MRSTVILKCSNVALLPRGTDDGGVLVVFLLGDEVALVGRSAEADGNGDEDPESTVFGASDGGALVLGRDAHPVSAIAITMAHPQVAADVQPVLNRLFLLSDIV